MISGHPHSAHNAADFAHPHTNVRSFGVTPGMKVADFGAGSGAYTHVFLEEVGKSGVVYAVDVQRELLRRIKNDAARMHRHVDVIWGDLEQPGGSKIADHVLDLVLISNVLFQLHDKHVIFQEARRVLKPGAKLVVIDWSESFGGLGPTKDHVVDKQKALTLARAEGFTPHDAFNAGAHHYGLQFTAPKHGHKKEQ